MTEIDLRSLIELGCIKEEIKIGEMTFILRTLNASEKFDLASILGDNPDASKMFDLNLHILAQSIETVNGQKLEDLHPNKDSGEPLLLKKQIISAMQTSVIQKLTEFYSQITERADAQFSVEQIKNS
jgi:hypothetical protein